MCVNRRKSHALVLRHMQHNVSMHRAAHYNPFSKLRQTTVATQVQKLNQTIACRAGTELLHINRGSHRHMEGSQRIHIGADLMFQDMWT